MLSNYLHSLCVLIILIFICYTNCANLPALTTREVKDGEAITLALSKFREGYGDNLVEELVTVPALGSVTLRATALPLTTSYLLFQAHAFLYNVTLSYTETLGPNSYVNGTNIGLVRPVSSSPGPNQVFLRNFDVNKNVTVLVVVQSYTAKDPVPGGCNMEFPVEVAPYLQVEYTDSLVKVTSQLAAPPAPMTCSSSDTLQYDVYHLYLTERDFESEPYFVGIRSMLTVERIKSAGRKVPMPVGLPEIQRIFSAYPGTGSVYAVVVSYQSLTTSATSAAYVPSVTYACSSIYWADTCEVLTSTFSKLVCAIIFFLGFFVCFVGHYFFKTQMFIFGFLSGGLISYVLVALPGTFEHGAHLLVAVLIGVVCGGFWLATWYFFAIPALSTVLVSLALGYFVAAITFFVGAGDLVIFQSDLNYWTLFVCVVLTAPMLLVLAGHVANIVGSSLLGAYAIIAPVDHYIGSNLKYIVINTVRRATDEQFRTAVIDPPFQVRDMCLVGSWIVLVILGTTVQLWLQRNKPPFPPPPLGVVRDREDMLGPERQPLLASQPRNTYASVAEEGELQAGPSMAR